MEERSGISSMNFTDLPFSCHFASPYVTAGRGNVLRSNPEEDFF